MGRIVAYRNVNTSSPKDTQTSFTTATASTAVSGTGLTTTQIEDLIVAMACGGQEAAWSCVQRDRSGGCVGRDQSPPRRRRRGWSAPTAVTTTVPTLRSAIFDAVKLTAGATGNLTATASVAAGHVVIAGAFKIVTPPHSPMRGMSTTSRRTSRCRTATRLQRPPLLRAAVFVQPDRITNGPTGTGKYYAEFLMRTLLFRAVLELRLLHTCDCHRHALAQLMSVSLPATS